MIDIPAAAVKYGISADRLRHWIKMGHLGARRVGRVYLVREADIRRLLSDPPRAGRPTRDDR